MLVASDEATWGSVIAKPERIFPCNKGTSHCSCCSLVPYLNNTYKMKLLPCQKNETTNFDIRTGLHTIPKETRMGGTTCKQNHYAKLQAECLSLWYNWQII